MHEESRGIPRLRSFVDHLRRVGATRRFAWAVSIAAAAVVAASVFGVVFSDTLDVHDAAAEVATAIFIAGLGIGVVPLTLLLIPRIGEARDPAVHQELHLTDARELLPITVSVLSAAAGIIHFAAIDQQSAGYWLFYMLFALLSVFQLAWAMLVFIWPSRLLYVVGGLANAATIAVWIDSRTVGVPIGPTAGMAEVIAFGDLTATIFEVLLVIGVIMVLRARAMREPRGPAAASVAFILTVLLIAPTTLALISSAGTHLLVPPSD